MAWNFSGGASREYLERLADHPDDYVLIVADYLEGGGPGILPDGALDYGLRT